MLTWVKTAVDAWTAVAPGIWDGTVFCAINKVGYVWGRE